MTRMLLDAASLYFRAFFGVPESVQAPDGTPTNAIRGFLDMTARLVASRKPNHLLACLDYDWRPAFRVAAVPSYKAHRVARDGGEEVPAALERQVPVLMAVLDALGIAKVGVAGFEADDIIGTATANSAEPVEVVTGDRDLFQVVREEPRVRVLYIARGVSKLEEIGPDEVAARYGIPGDRYADFAVLRGDPSDGLPGVAGVGDKTAAALITRFGSLQGALEAVGDDGFPAGARRRIEAAADYLAVAPAVVAVRADVPMPEHDDRLPLAPADPEALVELSDRYGLDRSLDRLLSAIKTVAPEVD
ncbi:MAG TPA: 5'-3' exonuclease, partial [Mycobacteriales bacterium]|nr:5'-3' exonuclease [Mycobacteriales bacterium]